MPSPSALHALRGGSARRQWDLRRAGNGTSPAVGPRRAGRGASDHRWDVSPPRRFHGYCDKPKPLAITERITERREFEWIRPTLKDLGKPVLFGYGESHHHQQQQRHRQPIRSSFQQPSPAGLLTRSSLFTSGSPRYHAGLGRSRQRPMTARPMTPRDARRADRPVSAASITSPVHHAFNVPASPRSRYFTGLDKALETAPSIDAAFPSSDTRVRSSNESGGLNGHETPLQPDRSLDSVFAEREDTATSGEYYMRKLMDI